MNTIQNKEINLEEMIAVIVKNTIQEAKKSSVNEWMSLKEGADYAKV